MMGWRIRENTGCGAFHSYKSDESIDWIAKVESIRHSYDNGRLEIKCTNGMEIRLTNDELAGIFNVILDAGAVDDCPGVKDRLRCGSCPLDA